MFKKWRKEGRKIPKGSEERAQFAHIMNQTSQTRFAFNSNAVSDVAIKQFWHDYSKVFEQARIEPPEAVGKDIDGAVEFAKGKEGKINGEKAKLEVDDLNKESAPADLGEVDKFMSEYRDNIGDLEAFKRISEMKDLPELFNENVKLKERFLAALEKNSARIGGDLELFIRGEFMKEPDQMTIMDFKALTNMLEKPGTWFQETRAKFHKNVETGKEDAPILSKWVHMMFPRSVDRLWLSKEMKLVETVVPTWIKTEKGDWAMAPVKGKQPQHRLGETQYLVSNLQRLSIDAQAREEKRIMSPELAKENLSWLSSIKDADRLHELAIMQLERGIGKSFYLKSDYGKADSYNVIDAEGNFKPRIAKEIEAFNKKTYTSCLLYTSPSPRD